MVIGLFPSDLKMFCKLSAVMILLAVVGVCRAAESLDSEAKSSIKHAASNNNATLSSSLKLDNSTLNMTKSSPFIAKALKAVMGSTASVHNSTRTNPRFQLLRPLFNATANLNNATLNNVTLLNNNKTATSQLSFNNQTKAHATNLPRMVRELNSNKSSSVHQDSFLHRNSSLHLDSSAEILNETSVSTAAAAAADIHLSNVSAVHHKDLADSKEDDKEAVIDRLPLANSTTTIASSHHLDHLVRNSSAIHVVEPVVNVTMSSHRNATQEHRFRIHPKLSTASNPLDQDALPIVHRPRCEKGRPNC